MTDYYAVLGVEPDATADIIKRAYRTLARRYHPDRNKAAEAEERFKAVAEAYAVLSNPAQRERYDQARRMAGAGQGEHWDAGVDSELFNEIFSRIFSSGSEPGAGRTYANQTFASDLFGQGAFGGGVSQPAPVDIELTLEEAHAGVLRTLAVTDPLGGERTVRRVRIPAGARPGQVLRIPLGKGEEPLRVRIRLTPHADYTWVGDQLVKNLAVTPWEAALGARMTIDTLGGRVALRIPAGSEAGRMLRVTGKGFAGGDLLVRLAIDAPMATTDEQRRAYEALRRSFDRCA